MFWGGCGERRVERALFWMGKGIGVCKVPASVLVSVGETEGLSNWGSDEGECECELDEEHVRTESEFRRGFRGRKRGTEWVGSGAI